MSRNLSGKTQTSLATRVTTRALCCQVIRPDGVKMGFTDHDQNIVFDAGDGNGSMTYEAQTSLTAAAFENQLGLAVSNTDFMFALSSDAITDDDLAAGRYDGATIAVWSVNWKDVTDFFNIMTGPLGQVQTGDLGGQAELRSLGQHFAQYIGSLCTPKCRAVSKFGQGGSGLEAGCHATLPAPVAGTVTAVTNRNSFTVSAVGTFPDGTKGSLAGGYFDYGSVSFTGSSRNSGVSREVRTSANPSLNTVTIVTREPLPLDISVGDTLNLQIGCDGLLETCFANYDQVDNYRAEPYVPGSDQVFRVHSQAFF